MKSAFIFPGQGSQSVGMGLELSLAFPEARDVFAEVDDALGEHLSRLIFEGPLETLTLTENTQPALMAVSLAVYRVLEKQGASLPFCVAGHSLGEYAALVSAKVLSLSQAARLLKIRGKAMQEAVPVGQGAMAAILGMESDTLEKVVAQVSGEAVCEIANDNAPGQIVISGHHVAVERAMKLALEQGAKRALLLPVSAPFHCSLMAPSARIMADALAEVLFKAPVVPVVANIIADFEKDPLRLKELLVLQVTGRVRWRESIQKIAAQGIDTFVEIGAGKILSGLGKRIVPEGNHYNLHTPQDVELFFTRNSE